MEQISEFVVNHWVLVTMFVMVATTLTISIFRSFEGVTPFQAVNLMNQNNALVLDVRKNDDYKKGHIIGALNLPVRRIRESISDLQKH
ncbi:MAG: rhodanese-like domain-containing protein, partial [Pseudomonadota bacterium]|nr:rhodanese-like domain-containing protein [Pseudomonadota bacterium]